jgi:para-nitrobenzyl esterase
MSADDVLKKVSGRFFPVVDGYVIPSAPIDIYAQNKQNHVSLLLGWNGDESFEPGNRKKEVYLQQIQQMYGTKATEFLKYFPAETDEQASKSEIELGKYHMFAITQYNWAITQSRFDDSPVYLYNFNRKVPAIGDFVKYGAFHTGEVAYAFNNLKFLNNRPFTETDNALAELMSSYWVNFIKTGNPNGPSVPEWPKFDINKNLVKVFDATSQTREVPNKDKLNFMLSTVAK